MTSDDRKFLDAIEALRPRYLARLIRQGLSLADAEDVVQITMCRGWRCRGNYRADGRLESWLNGILHRTVMNWVRDHRRKATESLEAPLSADQDLTLLDQLADPSGGPVDGALHDELHVAVLDQLEQLQRENPKAAASVRMSQTFERADQHRFEGVSYHSCANHLRRSRIQLMRGLSHEGLQLAGIGGQS